MGSEMCIRDRAGTAPARHWLERMQNADGGFGASPDATSNAAITGWAALGLEAAGRNPLDVRRGGRSAIGYLRSQVAELRSTGDLERTILALEGAGADPRSFGGRDLVAELRRRRSGNGSFEGQVNLTAFGVLALRAAGVSPSAVRSSAAWLRQAQGNDGGWGFQPDAGSDPDSTGAVLQGLAVAGGANRATARGTSYLRRAQRSDGGFALADGGPTNSQSTAWAVQGLIAGGTNPAVRTNGCSAFDYLEGRQAADGHYRYSQASDLTPVWVTAQALLAVSRKAFPLAAVPRSPAGARSGSGSGDSAGTASVESTQTDGSPTGGPVAGGRPSGGAPGDPAQPRQGVRGELAAGGRPDATGSPVAAATGDGGGPRTPAYVGAGFAVLTAALVGGFFWYRRRLPE